MTRAELEALSSYELFGGCAYHYDDDQYWEEFVRRYNECLTLSVYQIYRRFSGEDHPPLEAISDLLQEVYLKILRNKCTALRRFNGDSEVGAKIYLTHIAAYTAIDHLRWQRSVKRYALTESLDRPHLPEELRNRPDTTIDPYTDGLAENELIKIMRRALPGKTGKRDLMIFLLHIREGLTVQEIARTNIFDLKPTSIAHTLARVREKLREVMLDDRP